jgi:hypothetical protein
MMLIVQRQTANGSDIVKMEDLQQMPSVLANLHLQNPNLWLPRWRNIVHGNHQLTQEVGTFMPWSFNRRFRNALGLSKIYAKALWLMTYSKMTSKEQVMTKIFWKMSFPVMRHRFTVMMLKPNNDPHTGSVLICLTPGKHNKCTCEWKQCCLFFYPWGNMHYEFVSEGQ